MQTKLLRIGVVQMGSHFLEVEGEDFYNTFALASPHGSVAGKVRKSPPRLPGSLFLPGWNWLTRDWNRSTFVANPRRREQALRNHQTNLDCTFSRSVALTISLT
jgi:hypothetical protein